MDKRTLELTHEQIELLQKALGIAEVYYQDMVTMALKSPSKEDIEASKYWFNKGSKIGSFNFSLTNGEFDV